MKLRRTSALLTLLVYLASILAPSLASALPALGPDLASARHESVPKLASRPLTSHPHLASGPRAPGTQTHNGKPASPATGTQWAIAIFQGLLREGLTLDTNPGLSAAMARRVNHGQGRWLGRDRAFPRPMGANRYRWLQNNPFRYRDSNGLWEWEDAGEAAGDVLDYVHGAVIGSAKIITGAAAIVSVSATIAAAPILGTAAVAASLAFGTVAMSVKDTLIRYGAEGLASLAGYNLCDQLFFADWASGVSDDLSLLMGVKGGLDTLGKFGSDVGGLLVAGFGGGGGGLPPPSRPSWQASERDADLSEFGFRPQVPFRGGKEVGWATPGSVRPDWTGPRSMPLTVDVKNYNLETARGRASVVRNVLDQLGARSSELPAGYRQGVLFDIRGQNPSPDMLERMVQRLAKRSGGLLKIDDMDFLR